MRVYGPLWPVVPEREKNTFYKHSNKSSVSLKRLIYWLCEVEVAFKEGFHMVKVAALVRVCLQPMLMPTHLFLWNFTDEIKTISFRTHITHRTFHHYSAFTEACSYIRMYLHHPKSTGVCTRSKAGWSLLLANQHCPIKDNVAPRDYRYSCTQPQHLIGCLHLSIGHFARGKGRKWRTDADVWWVPESVWELPRKINTLQLPNIER